jgi:hypothetical protein
VLDQTAEAPPAQASQDQAPAPPVATSPQYTLPDYALHYAPYVYLHKDEKYWPANVATHVECSLYEDCSDAENPAPIDLSHLGKLNLAAMLTDQSINRDGVFLCHTTDPRKEKLIQSLLSDHGKPGSDHRSNSPCWIVWMDKSSILGEQTVDVFYFFFWAYNLGNEVIGMNFGNHVGDWEHIMIRFVHGKPTAVHLSAHSDGVAYTYDAMEKRDSRPVVYCAGGSHAFYAKSGNHAYSPVGRLGPVDHTSQGPLWDPTLNYIASYHDTSKPEGEKFIPVTVHGGEPGKDFAPEEIKAVLSFRGRWGNSFLGKSRHHDLPLAGKLKKLMWAQGPSGPRDKYLDRPTLNITNPNILHSI